MKKLLLTCTAAFAGIFLYAQTATEVLNNYIEASGGKDKWTSIQTMKSTGSLEIGGQSLDVVVTQVHNKGSRQDLNIAGMTGTVVTTPTGGWMFLPFQGQTAPEAISAEDAKPGIDDLDLQSSFIDFESKGHTAEYIGKEQVNGNEVHVVKMVRKNSGEQYLYFDVNTNLLLRTKAIRQINGQELDVTVDMSDYRDVDGMKFPFAVSQGMMGTIKMKSYEINPTVDEKIFDMPAGS